MIYASNLATGIKSLSNQFLTLQNTFATVETVNGEGLTVNVTLDMHLEGQTVLSNVPLIKMPYLNIPVREGDKVFLTSCSHLINNYFTTESFTEYIPSDSYVAIQCILDPKFNENEFTNHFTLVNPEKSFKWLIKDKESIVTAEEIDETLSYKSSTRSYKENLDVTVEDSCKIEAQREVSIKANNELKLNSPSIDLGSDSVKIGQLLSRLCNALASSQCIVTSGSSAGSYQSLSNAGEISSIGSEITSVFK